MREQCLLGCLTIPFTIFQCKVLFNIIVSEEDYPDEDPSKYEDNSCGKSQVSEFPGGVNPSNLARMAECRHKWLEIGLIWN
jgi:hypothetical protein